MNYAKIIKNDTTAGQGFCVSLYVQGCPHHCPGCFNPETWDFAGGTLFTDNVAQEIWEALTANNIQRKLCILGGEPLAPRNRLDLAWFIIQTRLKFPDIKIYIWTGYLIEDLIAEDDLNLINILHQIDYLIDGPFIESERDITLKMRGSKNQRILHFTQENNYAIIEEKEENK